MVEVRIYNQRRDVCRVLRIGKGEQIVLQLAMLDLNAMLSFRRKPAALESLRRYDDLLTFGGGPVEILVHRPFGDAPDNSRRKQDDDGQRQQQSNNAFSH